jgi:hypothetical protein
MGPAMAHYARSRDRHTARIETRLVAVCPSVIVHPAMALAEALPLIPSKVGPSRMPWSCDVAASVKVRLGGTTRI